MATLVSSTVFSMKGRSQIHSLRRSNIRATINITKTQISLPKIQPRSFVKNLDNMTSHTVEQIMDRSNSFTRHMIISPNLSNEKVVIAKMYAIMEAIADRVEMHDNIGAQRDNWNTLLLTSVNSITLTAATMSGIAAAVSAGSSAEALKLGATILYLAATGLLALMNKIQPSQLAEEQRNASRLFKQLQREIQTKLSLGNFSSSDVTETIERVLALDKAYPLPLLGLMLEKFPKKVEPAVWWPRKKGEKNITRSRDNGKNGWNEKLESEMREICQVIERKDLEDYLRLSKKALKLNKVLAISGPVLTGLGALGTALSHHGMVPLVVGVVGGALASVVSSFEHGGQVGMVFEMYRSNAGFFRFMEETIESNLDEGDFERRENGEVFETKVALQLGRSLSELRNLADNSRNSRSRKFDGVDHHDHDHEMEEFASKLF